MGGYSIFEDTIADMTWIEVDEAAQQGALMLVPVAVIEQHGPHLPLATDTYGAYLLCREVREHLNNWAVETVIAPPYYLGMNPSTGMFPGSIHISRDTMVQALSELLSNLGSFGFKRQFILNHHGDPSHNDAIAEAINRARAQGIEAVLTLGGFVGEIVEEVYASAFGRPMPLPEEAILRAEESEQTRVARERLTRSDLSIHAEERETSLIMRWFPQLLNEKVDVLQLVPVLPDAKQIAAATGGGKWREISPLGYIGDPSVATVENGELYALEAVDIAAAIKAFTEGKQ
jgi:creatinine amidohydrolase